MTRSIQSSNYAKGKAPLRKYDSTTPPAKQWSGMTRSIQSSNYAKGEARYGNTILS